MKDVRSVNSVYCFEADYMTKFVDNSNSAICGFGFDTCESASELLLSVRKLHTQSLNTQPAHTPSAVTCAECFALVRSSACVRVCSGSELPVGFYVTECLSRWVRL